MNKPSSTIKASGGVGALVAIGFILLAVLAPEYYDRLPPGASESLIVALSTLAGYFKKEKVLVKK